MAIAATAVVLGEVLDGRTPVSGHREPRPARLPLPRAVTAVPSFSHLERTGHFVLAASTNHTSLNALAPIAEDAWAAAGALLGQRAAEQRDLFPIFVCEDESQLRVLEKQHGLSGRQRRHYSAGGFYRTIPMIAFVKGKRVAEIIAHEVGHLAVAQITRTCPSVIDEGIAEVIEGRVLSSRADCQEERAASERKRWRLLEYAVNAGLVPELRDMFRRERFAAYSLENYGLAYCLCTVLCEEECNRPGTLRKLVELFGEESDRDPWDTFCSVYAPATIEVRWRNKVESIARGE